MTDKPVKALYLFNVVTEGDRAEPNGLQGAANVATVARSQQNATAKMLFTSTRLNVDSQAAAVSGAKNTSCNSVVTCSPIAADHSVFVIGVTSPRL